MMPHRFGGPVAAAALIATAITACAPTAEIAEIQALDRPTGTFEAALFDAYLQLAASERAVGDWRDADAYLARAERTSRGELVLPERPAERRFDAMAAAALETERDALVQALARGGRIFAPEDAARAQTAFDCWIEQSEEAGQPADAEACRAAFILALRAVQAAASGSVFTLLDQEAGASSGTITLSNPGGTIDLAEAGTATLVTEADAVPRPPARLDQTTIDAYFGDALAAEPDQPDRFTLYFLTGTTDLTPDSIALVADVLDAVTRRTAPRIDVIGHADRVGPAALNATLSLRRAGLVRQRLVDEGVEGATITTDSYGETDPVVPTPDEVPEPLNRRVEIVVR